MKKTFLFLLGISLLFCCYAQKTAITSKQGVTITTDSFRIKTGIKLSGSTDSLYGKKSDGTLGVIAQADVFSIASSPHYKQAVNYTTTAALAANTYANGSSGVGATITFNATGTQTLDGTLIKLDSSYLIKDEATQSHNGVYKCTTAPAVGVAGILTRRTDVDQSAEIVQGDAILVLNGSQYGGTSWYMATSGTITIGTTAIVFNQLTNTVIADGQVTNAKLAAMAAGTYKANITGGSAAPTDVTRASVVTDLNVPGLGLSNTYSSGALQTFAASTTLPDIRLSGFAGDPSSPTDGGGWNNTITHQIKFYLNGITRVLANLNEAQAFTNKDLTGAGNTFPTFNQNTTGTANIAGGTVGAIPYQSAANTTTVLAATATAGQMFRSGASAAPGWSTNTWPNTATTGDILVATGTNAIGAVAAVAAGSFLTSQGTSTAPAYLNTRGNYTTFVVSGSDVTTTGQTMVDITGLVSGTLTASTTYEVEAMLYVGTSAVSTGTQYAITGNGTGSTSTVFALQTGTTTTNAGSTFTQSATAVGGGTFLTTASAFGIIWIKGICTTRSTGTITISLQHLKVTSGTSTVKIGSWMKIRLLN